MATANEETVIDCRNLWKIFGHKAEAAMKAISEQGPGKLEVRDQFDCVVGVQDASFTVSRGEIFCIMGLSGSGKSTLIRHINRLIEPTSGQLFIEGQDVNAMSARELRQLRAEKIGMVFQNMALMPHRTVLENVSFSQEVRGHDIRAVATDGRDNKMLVTSRSVLRLRDFKTIVGLVSFLADMGCTTASIPLEEGGRERHAVPGQGAGAQNGAPPVKGS